MSGVRPALPVVLALVMAIPPLAAAVPVPAGQAGQNGQEVKGCRALQERRRQLRRRAMEEEIALVRGIRMRLCPDLVRSSDAGAGDDFDYGAWQDCRRQAERALAQTRTVLRRDSRRVPHYSAAGARLSEQADALADPIATACNRPSGGDNRP